MTRREREREEESGVLSVPTARDRTRGREGRPNTTEGEATGAAAAATIEREPPAGAAAAAIEREGEESEAATSCSLARQSVPTAAQHTSTFSRLSFPFFTAAAPSARTTAPRRTPRAGLVVPLLLGPACAPLSISLSPAAASRSDSRADCPLYPGDSPLLPSTSFLSFSPSTRVSSRTAGRSCNLGARARIYTRVLIIAEDGRAEERGEKEIERERERTVHM